MGDHLRKRRLDLGLRQRDVAALVNASRQTVAGWETRDLRPAPEFLPGVVEFVGYAPASAASPAELVMQLLTVRHRLRLARSEVAEMLGLSYAALWAWETGRRRPRGRSVVRLREFLAACSGNTLASE